MSHPSAQVTRSAPDEEAWEYLDIARGWMNSCDVSQIDAEAFNRACKTIDRMLAEEKARDARMAEASQGGGGQPDPMRENVDSLIALARKDYPLEGPHPVQATQAGGRTAFEWSCLLRHDGNYDQKTRDGIHEHNERLIQQAMDAARIEGRRDQEQFHLEEMAENAPAPSAQALREAAQAVIDRWDSPKWKDLPHTGEYIDRLRAALTPSTQQQKEETTNGK